MNTLAKQVVHVNAGVRTPFCAAPLRSRVSVRRISQLRKAVDSNEPTNASPESSVEAAKVASPSAAPPPPVASDANTPLILVKGQGTAIVTGAISIIFGVAYLALVAFMDSRGGEMLPPPPEAFLP